MLSSWDPLAFGLTGVALVAIFRLGWSPLRVIGLCAGLGVAVWALGAIA